MENPELKYIEAWRNLSETSKLPDWYTLQKKNAEQWLTSSGTPLRKNEKYKYANIPALLEKYKANEISSIAEPINLFEIFNCDVPGLDTINIFIVNGKHYGTEKLTTTSNGVIYGSLREAILNRGDLIKEYIGKLANENNESFLQINTLLYSDGLFIYVPENVKLSKPIQLINISHSSTNLTSNYRNLIIVQDNSALEFIECNHTLSEKAFLTNSVTEIIVGNNATYNHVKMHNENSESAHISNGFLEIGKATNSTYHAISLNGGYVRNNITVNINGEYSKALVHGLSVTKNKQYVDNYVLINHNKANCESNQLFKSVIDHNSEVSFNGKIFVAREAQKTNAYQSNKNLVLNKEGKCNTRPQLEIYADDVKCSHGATVGKLDQESLFYLRARGIPFEEARLLLMYAFADDVIQSLHSDALKARVKELTEARLRGDLSKCKCCSLHCN